MKNNQTKEYFDVLGKIQAKFKKSISAIRERRSNLYKNISERLKNEKIEELRNKLKNI